MNCYVYRIFDGAENVYVGKGSGSRLTRQMRKFRLPGEIIEACADDDTAFNRERFWILELRPTSNISRGGGGGRVKADGNPIPKSYRSRISLSEFRAERRRYAKFLEEFEALGSKRYCARELTLRLNEANCEQFGVSKLDLDRIRWIAAS